MSEEIKTTVEEEIVKDEAAPAEAAEAAPAEPIESMDDYKEELEASFRQIRTGDIIEGTVIDVNEEAITVDLGYYTDGIIYLADASDDPSFSLKDQIQPGQTLKASVVRRDDGAGHILLSMKEAAAEMSWDRLRELHASKGNVTVKITDTTRAGVIAYLEGIRGFIPASKLALEYVEEDALKSYVGKSIEVRVLDVDEEDKKLVLSARDILWEKEREERTARRDKEREEKAARLSEIEVGLVTEGVVRTIKPYGAFVTLNNGVDGLLHVSQISQKRINSPAAVLKEGQTVTVKVIANKDGKLSLSMKALTEIFDDAEEEAVEIPEEHSISTNLGSLLAGFKFDN